MADWMEELERLGELRQKGFITEEEFDAERELILPSQGKALSHRNDDQNSASEGKLNARKQIKSVTEKIETKAETDSVVEENSSKKWILIVTGIGFIIPVAYDRPVALYDHMLSGFTAFLVCIVILALGNIARKFT